MSTAPPRALGALVTLAATLLAGIGLAPHAGAAAVSPDAETAVRDIVFPVDGEHSYTDTFGACRSGCARGHEGTDIMTPKLTPLVAATDATVTWSKDGATPDGSNGNYLMLRDDEGWEYWYIHINNDSPGTDDGANPKEWIFAPGIERGTKVKAGQLVAYAGDSGNAEHSGSHLHFEIHEPDGSVINPYRSLQRAEGSSSAPQYVADRADESFVRALAVDFLDRAATDDEVRRDAGRLARGVPRAEVVAEYASSDEWIAALVTDLYESTLGRGPDDDGLRHWSDQIAAGATPAAVAAHFYGSGEYYVRAGDTDEAWISDLYRELLDREPDAEGLEQWVDEAGSGTPRARIAASFHGSLESRHSRVTELYAALLGRHPDADGLGHWADRLRDGRDIALAVSLAVSDEYHARAGGRADLT